MEQEGKRKIVSLSKSYISSNASRMIQVRATQSDGAEKVPVRVFPGKSSMVHSTASRSVLINPSSSAQMVKIPAAPFKLIAPNAASQGVRCVIFKDGHTVNVRKAIIPRQVASPTLKMPLPSSQLLIRPVAPTPNLKRQLSAPMSPETSLDGAAWRIARSATDTPRQYGRQREAEEEKEKSSGHGVNEYLFGVSKKRSRSPSPVREAPPPEITYRPSRRKQNPTVLKDDDEIQMTEPAPVVPKEPTEPEPTVEQFDESTLNLIDWKSGVGTLPGLDGIEFRINKYNLLTLYDRNAEEFSQDSVTNSQELLVCTQCGTYGMSSEFVERRFCSRDCTEERRRRKMDVKKWKEMRRKRRDNHKLAIKKLQVGHRLLNRKNLVAASSVVYIELLRQRMCKEQIKLEMTDKKLLYQQYPDAALYAEKVADKAAPASLFKEIIPHAKNPFKLGWKLEAIDPRHPALICVATVVETRGHRVRLRFDRYGAQHDFWVNANSCEIFQPGWCERTDHNLTPPRGWEGPFNWTIYLEKRNASAAPRHAFSHPQERTVTPSGFRVGMKLEAVDKNFTRNVCSATIIDVIDNRILIHIDGTSYEHDYWADNSSPYIHPAGWCADNNYPLYNTPYGKLFRWDHMQDGKAFMAPARAFKIRPPHELKIGHKIEAVDKRNPELVRIATIVNTQPHQIRIKFDGWPAQYAYWIDDDSPEYHPFGWCMRTGHPLEKPPGIKEANGSIGCRTPGCTGVGHAYRCSPDHISSYACPYSPENYLRDDIVPRRFRSFDEYLSVKKHSQSKGTKPRTLLSKRAKLSEKKPKILKQIVDSPPSSAPPSPKKREKIKEKTPEKDDDMDLKQEISEKIAPFLRNPRAWSIEDVEKFVDEMLGSKGDAFRDEMVDGEALLMISKHDLKESFGFKLGPAITFFNCIQILREIALECGTEH